MRFGRFFVKVFILLVKVFILLVKAFILLVKVFILLVKVFILLVKDFKPHKWQRGAVLNQNPKTTLTTGSPRPKLVRSALSRHIALFTFCWYIRGMAVSGEKGRLFIINGCNA